MNGVKFIRQKGGLGRTLTGADHISALIIYGETAVEKTLLLSEDDLPLKGITPENNPVLHYHASEFFRICQGAKLYVQAVATSDGTYTEVKVLQNYAEGNIRQIAVCDFQKAVSTLSNAVKKLNEIATDLSNHNTPLSVLLSLKVAAADMATLPDLHTLASERVSVVLGQDKGGRGGYLAATHASLSAIGAVLGAVAKAAVHESIGWVEHQNMVSTAYEKTLTAGQERALELDTIGFCDGSAIGDYTEAQLQNIHDKGYLFFVKYTGTTGSYLNDSFTATTLTDDYAYIENNRTIDKAVRIVNRTLVPKVSGPAYVDPDTGKLHASTIAALEALCDAELDQMQRSEEISGYKVEISPDQRVLQTSKLEVILKIIPVGTLREIIVKIGLTLSKN